MRTTTIVAGLLAIFLLAGCGGGGETVTQEDLDAMSDEDALMMGECQMQKMADAEGEEAVNRYIEQMGADLEADMEDGQADQDVVPMQIELSEKGYTCPEYLP